MLLTFYNVNGSPVAYLDDDKESIFLFNGRPVAYLYGDCIYGYSGKVLGWYEDGWMRDLVGGCLFFTEKAIGGPARPAKQAKPSRGAKWARPAKGARSAKPARPAKSVWWSQFSIESFFEQ